MRGIERVFVLSSSCWIGSLHALILCVFGQHATMGVDVKTRDGAVIKTTDLPAFAPAPGASLRMLAGEDHGLGMCLIVAEYPPGAETPSHRHPNSSAIFVREGRGMFKVGDKELVAEAGDIVLVPANAWHSFRNDGDAWLRVVGADEGARHDAELAG